MKYPDERYRQDAHFKRLVDMLYHLIKGAEFTSTDIREAIMLAQIHYEYDNPRPVTVSPAMQDRMRMHQERVAEILKKSNHPPRDNGEEI